MSVSRRKKTDTIKQKSIPFIVSGRSSKATRFASFSVFTTSEVSSEEKLVELVERRKRLKEELREIDEALKEFVNPICEQALRSGKTISGFFDTDPPINMECTFTKNDTKLLPKRKLLNTLERLGIDIDLVIDKNAKPSVSVRWK